MSATREKLAPTLDDVRSWPSAVAIPTACTALGISASQGYKLAQRGLFPARLIPVGRSYRVSTDSLVQVLAADANDVA